MLLNNFIINSIGVEEINKEKLYFTAEDLENILEGSILLASGGGGAREDGRSLMKAILHEGKKVEYISPEQVGDKEYMAVVGGIGAPEAVKEFGFGYSARRAFELLEKVSKAGVLQNAFSCALSGETGAVSQFITMLVAVQKNIPVVDGDGAGRAFPSLQMATFASNPEEIPISPVVLVNSKRFGEGGTEIVIYQKNPSVVDEISRSIIESKEFNEIASFACFTMNGKAMKKVIVRNTFTQARDVGKIIKESQGASATDFLQKLEEKKQIKGYLLFKGTVTEVENKTSGGFDFGKVTIEKDEEEINVIHQNENLSAFLVKDNKLKPLAFVPDLICYMELDGNKIKQPLSNVDIRKNKEVALIGFRADEKLRCAYLLEAFTKARGNLGDFYKYQRIEDLNKAD
ncbi:MAG: DUF917 domain-containing protein [Bacteroidota bacterium]|nr:DUF917 domain-containing protein [Bacteroidota bacterium]